MSAVKDWLSRTSHDVGTLVGIGVVAVAAAVMSFASLQQLGERAGYHPALAMLLPVAIDAQAVVATRAWLAGSTPPKARSYARGLALSAIVLSVIGNAGEHAMQAYGVATPWWVLLGVSAVPPIALAATAHLAAVLAISSSVSQALAETSTTGFRASAGGGTETTEPGVLFRPEAPLPSARPVPPNPAPTTPTAPPAASSSSAEQSAPARPAPSSATSKARTGSGSSTRRSDEELRAELAAAIANESVDVDVTSAESIRRTLACSPKRARQLRDEHQAIERPHLAVVGDRA